VTKVRFPRLKYRRHIMTAGLPGTSIALASTSVALQKYCIQQQVTPSDMHSALGMQKPPTPRVKMPSSH
jgi:hypothetical protein